MRFTVEETKLRDGRTRLRILKDGYIIARGIAADAEKARERAIKALPIADFIEFESEQHGASQTPPLWVVGLACMVVAILILLLIGWWWLV